MSDSSRKLEQSSRNARRGLSSRSHRIKVMRLVAIGDLIAILLALLLVGAFLVSGHDFFRMGEHSKVATFWGSGVIFTVELMFALYINRAYSWHVCFSPARGMRLVIRSTVYAVALFWVFVACFGYEKFHSGIKTYVAWIALTLLFVTFARLISSKLVSSFVKLAPARLLVAGTVSDINQIFGENIRARFPHYEIGGILLVDYENKDNLTNVGSTPVQRYVIGDRLADHVQRLDIDAVWIASVSNFGDKNLRRLTWDLKDVDARLYLEPMIGGIAGTRISHENVGTRATLYVSKPRFNAANGLVKRVADLVGATIILILISPLFLFVAIAIKLDDGGPIFYSSERIGLYGKPFKMWKFRSMVTDAEAKIEALAKETGSGYLLFKMKDDPRITKIGKFIRRTSIDELPQFFNCLNGTMSIVGPRPQVQREVDTYSSDMRMRLEVKPGVTGLWQVSGRSDLTPQQAENLDLYYADNWSMWLDIVIFFRTFTAVLTSKGAY